jgi:hypothetical protein
VGRDADSSHAGGVAGGSADAGASETGSQTAPAAWPPLVFARPPARALLPLTWDAAGPAGTSAVQAPDAAAAGRPTCCGADAQPPSEAGCGNSGGGSCGSAVEPAASRACCSAGQPAPVAAAGAAAPDAPPAAHALAALELAAASAAAVAPSPATPHAGDPAGPAAPEAALPSTASASASTSASSLAGLAWALPEGVPRQAVLHLWVGPLEGPPASALQVREKESCGLQKAKPVEQ